MSNYPNAAQGLKLMFWAEIAVILCTVLMLIPLVNLIGILVTLAAGIVSLVGLYKAGNDAEGYKTAFALTIISLVIGLFSDMDNGIGALLSIAESVLDLAVVYYVCVTTAKLLTAVGNLEVAEQAKVWKVYLICTVIGMVCSVLTLFPILDVLAAFVLLIAAFVMIGAGILYLVFLYKSYRALGAL